ncbi:MAG TPA: hypothetical protein GX720_05670 [Clostridiaceae bacterium]|nr:hypothetical protein [Clostridiaceae bacterium]
MKERRSLVIVLVLFALLSLLASRSGVTDAAPVVITDPADMRIVRALAGIDRQDFSQTATNAQEVKDKILHFTFDSTFAAIGGGNFPYPNGSGSYYSFIQDNKYAKSITPSTGCMAYSRFVSKVIYDREGDWRGEGRYPVSRTEDFKELLLTYGQAGDHIRAYGSTAGKVNHSLSLISCYEEGFYVLEHQVNPIQFSYFTYADFIQEYSSHILFLYDSNPGQNTKAAPSFTILFDPNGGSGGPEPQAETADLPFVMPSAQPVRAGHHLMGWSKNKNAHLPDYLPGSPVTLSGVTGDFLTLYAVWIPDTALFRDVPPGAWYFEYVENMAIREIVHGYGTSGQFRPDNPIQRQHLAKIAVRAAGLEYEGMTADFPDVDPGGEMSPYIAALMDSGVIQGYPDGTFRPTIDVSRAELSAIISRVFHLRLYGEARTFDDLSGHWSEEEVAILISNGIVKGYADGSFRPNNPITRAEASKIVTIAMAVSAVQDAEDLKTAEAVAKAQDLINSMPQKQDLATRQALQARLDAVETGLPPAA